MILPQVLMVKKFQEQDLKDLSDTVYDLPIFVAKNESGGIFIDGSTDIAAAAAAGSVDVKPVVAYPEGTGTTVSAANGTIASDGGDTFAIEVSGTIQRIGTAQGTVKLRLIGSTAGTIQEIEVENGPNAITRFTMSVPAQALVSSETVKLTIVRSETVTAETFVISDFALTLESDA